MGKQNAQGVQGSALHNRPVKNYRVGNFSGAVWKNEKDLGEDGIVSFLTATLRRSWKDKNTSMWRDETINLRKADLAKAIVILNKMQEDLMLANEGDDHDE